MAKLERLEKDKYFTSTALDPMEERLKEISRSKKTLKKGKRVVLVVPPSPQIPTPGREFLVSGPFEGFTYVATLIKKMGYELDVVDCRLKDDPERLVLDAAKDADLIGMASYCDSFAFLQDATRALKERYPEKLILLGGPLVTSLPDVILSSTSADCAVISEGELTIIEFLDRYLEAKSHDFEGIKGLACKKNGRVRVNPARPQIKDLDNLPMLDYTIWPNYESIVKNGQILISSTRGCPQQCTFCFKTIPMLRMKSLERFEAEVSYLKKATNFDYTWLNDLTFNVIEDRAMKIAQVLKKHGIRYHCFARVRNVSAGLVRMLKDTGCLGIWFGIESYEQDILDYNRKNITIDDIIEAVKTAEDGGLAVRGLFIVGLYGETEESLKKMVAFIRQSKFLPLVKYLVPFPGTTLFRHALKTGKISDPLEFLKMLSRRRVKDYDDEIINLTALSDDTLRHYFHQIWTITQEREKLFEEPCLA